MVCALVLFGRRSRHRSGTSYPRSASIRVITKKGSTQASEGTSPIEADYSEDTSNGSIPQPKDSVNRKFSISKEISSDIRYSIDETPETPDVSENRDLTVSFCSDRESK
jgi:hypothetical protein